MKDYYVMVSAPLSQNEEPINSHAPPLGSLLGAKEGGNHGEFTEHAQPIECDKTDQSVSKHLNLNSKGAVNDHWLIECSFNVLDNQSLNFFQEN